MLIFPINWYWSVGGNTSQYWSTRAAAYVPTLPAGVVASAIDTEQNLTRLLVPYALPGPVAYIPDTIDMWILRTVLQNKGLLAQVQTAIDNSTDVALKNLWAYGYVTHRNSRFITALTNALGLTSAQVDQVFLAASSVVG